MGFVALDVETANEDLASICQIGVATFVDGTLTCEWKSYVDPEDYFSPVNVSIHGINEQTIRGAPTFESIIEQLHEKLDGAIAVHHTFFDRAAITSAAGRYGVRPPGCKWLDTARIARRTWPEVRRSGYGLRPLCESIGYHYQAHDALEAAKAAAQVLLQAVRTSGIGVDEWLLRAYAPIAGAPNSRVARDGDPDGPLWGEVVVFTGALSLPRAEAADIAARLGCRVGQGVTKETTILVVGDQDVGKLNGHDKSSKQRKAEQLAAAGQPIRFLSETQFSALTRILEDGAISLDERVQAKAGVTAVAPGDVPVGLGVVERTRRAERADLLSVQFLRDASGSTEQEALRALDVFGALAKQDLELALSRIEQFGDCFRPAEVLDELEHQIAAFSGVFGTVNAFLNRSCLHDDSQRLDVLTLTRRFVRTRLEALRGLLASIEQELRLDDRIRALTLVERSRIALAAVDTGP